MTNNFVFIVNDDLAITKFMHTHTSFIKPFATRIIFTSNTGSMDKYGPSFFNIGNTASLSCSYWRQG